MIWICVPPKFICWNHTPQGNGIRRWDLSERIRSWGQNPYECVSEFLCVCTFFYLNIKSSPNSFLMRRNVSKNFNLKNTDTASESFSFHTLIYLWISQENITGTHSITMPLFSHSSLLLLLKLNEKQNTLFSSETQNLNQGHKNIGGLK